MNPRVGWAVIITLGAIILVLIALLIIAPTPAPKIHDTKAPSVAAQPFTSDNVNVSSPLPNALVPKTFTILGEARGTWYFEASFPVQVRDPSGNLLAETPAKAQSDWMTEGWVPFKATLTVSNYSGPATLVLMKDNPSGLPENEDSVEFPILIQ